MLPALALAAALTGPPDRPPECVPVVIAAAQSNGAVRRLRFVFCGFGPSQEPPMRDRVAHKTLILDGGGLPGRDCGTKTAPCVVFGP